MKDESEEKLPSESSLTPVYLSSISVHMLTCPARAQSCAATLARWDATDWGKACGRPRIHRDDAPEEPTAQWGEATRGERIVAAFARMMQAAVDQAETTTRERPGRAGSSGWSDWLLFLEDDLQFHPRIGAAVASWKRLWLCWMASLFNPGLQENKKDESNAANRRERASSSLIDPSPRDFSADPATFLGAQALLLTRRFARYALTRWNTVKGMQSQRLATLNTQFQPAASILVHRPSLVQHLPVAGGSGWGARVQQALDFDPNWQPLPP